jgi:hypothetical protein
MTILLRNIGPACVVSQDKRDHRLNLSAPHQQHEQHPRARGLGDDLPATLTSMNNLAEIRPELEELSL